MNDHITLVQATDCQLGDTVYVYVNARGQACAQDKAAHTLEACIIAVDTMDNMRAVGWRSNPVHTTVALTTNLSCYLPSRLRKVSDFSCYQFYRWLDRNDQVGRIQQASSIVFSGGAVNDHVCPSCGNTRTSKTERSCWRCGNPLH